MTTEPQHVTIARERSRERLDYAERIFSHYFRAVGLGSERGWDSDYDAELGAAVEAIADSVRLPLEARIADLEDLVGSLRRTLDSRTEGLA